MSVCIHPNLWRGYERILTYITTCYNIISDVFGIAQLFIFDGELVTFDDELFAFDGELFAFNAMRRETSVGSGVWIGSSVTCSNLLPFSVVGGVPSTSEIGLLTMMKCHRKYPTK